MVIIFNDTGSVSVIRTGYYSPKLVTKRLYYRHAIIYVPNLDGDWTTDNLIHNGSISNGTIQQII